MKTVSKKLLSILLVAVLLVSAVPFQAFADHDATHVMGAWTSNGNGTHSRPCSDSACTYVETNTCYGTNGICDVCGFACPHPAAMQSTVNAVAATCITAGYTGDVVCGACNTKISTGSAVPATGAHNFVAGKCTTPGCPATQVGAPHILTLNAGAGATVNGGATLIVNVNENSPIAVLPDAVKPGYTFVGWYVGGTKLELAQNYPFTNDATAEARFAEKTFTLTVRRVLNGDNSSAKTIYTHEVSAGTNVLDYVKANVTSTVTYELSITPGFSWENNYWYDFSGTQPLTSQADFMNAAMTVYVNFKSNPYTLYFQANGGIVTPTYKSVYFGSKVGTLPIPTKSGSVFQGWKDANGVLYTADTVYQVAGDTTLTAVWQDEALVILYVYTNGNFSTCDRMIVMDGFVKNNNISRADVVGQVQNFYKAASGYLNIAGVFDEARWASYRSNTSLAGYDNVPINNDHVNKIYVMVTNAATGATIVTGTNGTTNGTNGTGAFWVSTGNGTGYWAYPNGTTVNGSTNPKTGDTAMIEAAAAVMVLAAGALVAVMQLRKRKMI